MVASIGLVVIGFLIARLDVHDLRGNQRIAPAEESAAQVLTSGVRLAFRRPEVGTGFLVRLINTAPEFGWERSVQWFGIVGSAVVRVVLQLGGSDQAVVRSFVGLSAVAFVLVQFLRVPQVRATHGTLETVTA
jgi:hypothetical protein